MFVWNTNSSTKPSSTELLSQVVSKAQQELTKLGIYEGLATGEIDSITRSAVLEFQTEHGLPKTGVLTPRTILELGLKNPLDKSLSTAELVSDKFAKPVKPEHLALAGFSANLVEITKVFEHSKLTYAVFEENLYVAVQVPTLRSWKEIAEIAKKLNGHIVSITSSDENQFVFEMISKDPTFWHPDGIKTSWIGPAIGFHQKVGCREPDQGWVWQSDEEAEYTNWLPSQPNNWNNEEHIAVFMNSVGAISDGSAPKVSDKWGDYWGNASAFVLEFANFQMMEEPFN